MRVEIATGTVVEFITDYLTADGKRNSIIGQASVNGRGQFIDIPEVWGSSLTYVSNDVITEYRGWGAGGWTGTDITNSTAMNRPSSTGKWGRTINDSPDDFPRSPVYSCIVRSRNRNEFLHHRQLERLWSLYNPSTDGKNWFIDRANTRLRRRIQYRDFLIMDTDHLAPQ